jgi:hypothetical protein
LVSVVRYQGGVKGVLHPGLEVAVGFVGVGDGQAGGGGAAGQKVAVRHMGISGRVGLAGGVPGKGVEAAGGLLIPVGEGVVGAQAQADRVKDGWPTSGKYEYVLKGSLVSGQGLSALP